MTDSFVVDRSLIVLPPGDARLSVQMLAGNNRPEAVVASVAAKQTLIGQWRPVHAISGPATLARRTVFA
jgi:hypothetical protein